MRQSNRRITRRSVLTGVSAAGLSATGLSAIGSPSFAQSAPAVHSKTKITVTGFYRTPAFHIAQRRGLFAKASVQYGQYARGYSLSFVEPYLLDYRVALGLDFFQRHAARLFPVAHRIERGRPPVRIRE